MEGKPLTFHSLTSWRAKTRRIAPVRADYGATGYGICTADRRPTGYGSGVLCASAILQDVSWDVCKREGRKPLRIRQAEKYLMESECESMGDMVEVCVGPIRMSGDLQKWSGAKYGL
jgi:hypothetical protein